MSLWYFIPAAVNNAKPAAYLQSATPAVGFQREQQRIASTAIPKAHGSDTLKKVRTNDRNRPLASGVFDSVLAKTKL
jgi:hypothetical protein